MRRIILLICVCLSISASMQAQNANRKGFFVELQGGAALGEVLTVIPGEPNFNNSLPYYLEERAYLKGGAIGSLDLGYRFRLSKPLAVEARIGAFGNFGDFKNTWLLRIMPGLRWTFKDFAGAKSIYASLNAGIGFGQNDGSSLMVPLEIGVGMNFTPHLCMGVYSLLPT